MERIVLYPNPTKPHIGPFAEKVLERVTAAGFTAAAPPHATSAFPDRQDLCFAEGDRLFSGAKMVIVLGGDGTILQAAAQAAKYGTPMLGINMGKLGFMTELEPEELPLLDRVLAGEYTLDRRMMLQVEVYRGEQRVYDQIALNEAIIAKGRISRAIGVEIFTDSVPLIRYSGDGVILCTPTGSTAYSMSAGGPIVEPVASNIIITPVCAHVLGPRSFVVRPDCAVSARVIAQAAKIAYLSTDGGDEFPLSEKDLLKVGRAREETLLVRANGRSFSEIIDKKFSRIRSFE